MDRKKVVLHNLKELFSIKKKVICILALFLIAMILLNFYNVYKTKYLIKDFLSTDHLGEEVHKISILNESTTKIININKDNPLFLSLTESLEDLKVKRSNSHFSYTEGYMFIIYHKNSSYHISINEKGMLRIDSENYRIQEEKAIKDLIALIKEAFK